MARKNSIATSEYKDWIEEQLTAGTPYRKLADELGSVGFNISHNALAQYHKKYLGGRVESQPSEQTAPELPALNIDSDTPIKEMVREMYKRQLQIVAFKQAEYLAGNCRFPAAEIKALKLLLEIAKRERADTGRDEDDFSPTWR